MHIKYVKCVEEKMCIYNEYSVCRSRPLEVLSWKGAPEKKKPKKKRSKSTREHQRLSATPTKLLCSFIEITPNSKAPPKIYHPNL